MKRRIVLSAALSIWVLVVAAGYLLSKPALLNFSPQNTPALVAANTPLRIEFSHRMQDDITSGALNITPAVEGKFHWEETTLVFTPSQGWPSRATIQVQLEPGLKTARWPWLSLTEGADWSFTVRQPLLLYLYPAGGAANLYIVDVNTKAWLSLTQFTSGVLEYEVDIQNDWVYYSRENGRGGTDIYRRSLQYPGVPAEDGAGAVSALSSAETQVTFCGSAECREPRLSAAGDVLAYERTSFDAASGVGLVQVWVAALDEISETSAGYLPAALDHQTFDAAWSSRGWLAFYNSTRLEHVLLNPVDGESLTLQNDTGQPGVWTPDGSAYLTTVTAFSDDQTLLPSGVETSVNQRILLFDLDTRQVRDLTGSSRLEDAFPSPSPNGLWLAYTRRDLELAQWVPGRQVWLMDLASGESHPLTNSANSDHHDLVWTPDSAELAFVRFDQAALVSPPEIWILEPRFGESRRVVTGGFAPRWIP